jgi:proteic killer suppression protein
MILSYRDARTKRFAQGERIKAFEPFRRQAEDRLERLEAAIALSDLAALRGNRLEKLAGDRRGQWSIRINDQWRICFAWDEAAPGARNVEIVDYH